MTAPATPHELNPLTPAIDRACALIPPLFTLRNFVAVNPYLGLSDTAFGDALSEIDQIKHAKPLLEMDAYWSLWRSGRITDEDIDEAITFAQAYLGRSALRDLTASEIRAALFEKGRGQARIPTYAELVDLAEGGSWNTLIVEEIGKWCAGRFDRGQSSWPQPYSDQSIYQAWRSLARLDRVPEIRGLEGFRTFVSGLPSTPDACIAQLIKELGVPEANLADVLARELASVAGWAGHLQYRIRQAGMEGRETDERLSDLLAIRLAFDAALFRQKSSKRGLGSWANAFGLYGSDPASVEKSASIPSLRGIPNLESRHIWQIALETGYQRALLQQITAHETHSDDANDEPFLQAAFCIDVRSEILRRNLEGCSDRIQTIGFAGFFGVALEAIEHGSNGGEARCPALLSPAYRIRQEEEEDPDRRRDRRRRKEYHALVKELRLSSVFAFPFVETIGQFFGARLLTDSLRWTRPGPDSRLLADAKMGTFSPVVASEESSKDEQFGLTLEQRARLAAGILKNTGLTRFIAPYVLFCGHGSTTTNNPFGSSLDCGACGGYSGDINARAAAAVLNDPEVRSALPELGYAVPDKTRFLAGLHDTTTDEITLYDVEDLAPQDLGELRRWLDAGSAATRKERAARLGPDPGEEPGEIIHKRSSDWSEVRPEWGLAGNAAFIAAPRERTRGIDLGGRVFLHDYHQERDPEGDVLELILTAPLVVASWISLQYFGSTVDNARLGSGSKTIHNVVGRHGVLAGNGGDLQVGLPFQSVHDGETSAHEPLRLTAMIEASHERITEILHEHAEVRELLDNQWLHLISIDPDGRGSFRYTSNGFQRIEDGERN